MEPTENATSTAGFLGPAKSHNSGGYGLYGWWCPSTFGCGRTFQNEQAQAAHVCHRNAQITRRD